MSIYGYKKKGGPALFLSLPGYRINKSMKRLTIKPGKKVAKAVKGHWKRQPRRKAGPSKAIWQQAFPAQVEPNRVKRVLTERALYRFEAREFKAKLRALGHTCPVFMEFHNLPARVQEFLCYANGRRRSNVITEIHHIHGRRGKLLRFSKWWLGVSKAGHEAIHNFPEVARKFGWICPEGQWNVEPKNYE